jgi:hypothetical protein
MSIRAVSCLVGGCATALACAVAASGGGAGSSQSALKESLDLPYSALGEEREEEEAPELIVFYGGIYEADAFLYCLDRSLSMAEGEWQTLQRELTRNIRELRPGAQFGLAFFAREVVAFPESKRPADATAANKAAATALVDGLAPDTWTCLLDGLRTALEMANRSTVARRAVILLGDGKPTCPGTPFATYREEIFALARALNLHRVPIHTVGIGGDVDEDFLNRLAAEHGGTYRRIGR